MEINEKMAKRCLEIVDAGLVEGLGDPIPGKMCVEAAINYALGYPHNDSPSCVSPTLCHLKIDINDSWWSSNAARAKGLRRLALAQLGSAGELDEVEFIKRIALLSVQFTCSFALRRAAKLVKSSSLLAAASNCENAGTLKEAAGAAGAAAEAGRAAAWAAWAAEAAEAAGAARAAGAAAEAAGAAAWAAAGAAGAAEAAGAARAAGAAAEAAEAAAWAAEAAGAARAAEAAEAAEAAAGAGRAAVAVGSVAGDKFLVEFCERVVKILIDMNAPGCKWLYLTE